MKLLCLFLCLGVSLAAPTTQWDGCKFPEKWESKLSITTAMQTIGFSFGIMGEGTLHVDSKNSKVAVKEVISRDSTDGSVKIEKIDSVQDYAAKKMYIFDRVNGWCVVTPITPPGQGKDKVTFLGRRKIGWNKQSMEVNAFNVDVASPKMYLKQYQTDECMPTMLHFRGNFNGVNVLQGQTYSDSTTGIKDMSVFDIPSSCNEASDDISNNPVLNHVIATHLTLRH